MYIIPLLNGKDFQESQQPNLSYTTYTKEDTYQKEENYSTTTPLAIMMKF
jgi:hypothetical protein